ncbi:hypothetical protein ATANTOWER_008766 [Ataeniobius toweri]|uniref:Uncharacterized protein n=1 Tax=Ataeniobius toweri TaxID=208326 RepID=A0ABU7BJF3_9TELE|nr:hypothetical protein [Ataeniobius toweri]
MEKRHIKLEKDQAGSFLLPSFPGPRYKRVLSTLQRKYLHIELSPEITKLTQTAPKNSSENLSFDNPDSEFLYPWRPDRSHLLLIRPFTFLDCLRHNKNIILFILSLRSVLLYVGQIYYENNYI